MARRFAWVCLAALACLAPAAADPPSAHTSQTDDASDDLALAAACLDRGEETAAAAHLGRHLATHPDRPFVRFSLAEMHWRHDRLTDARAEFERFLADAPDTSATA